MKTFNVKFLFLNLLALMLVSIFMTSCENDIIQPTPQTSEEGFVSTTNRANQTPVSEDDIMLEEPLLHMTFDQNLSREEVEARWQQAVQEFMEDYQPASGRAVSTEWFSYVYIRTGSQAYNHTNGAIKLRLNFETDNGTSTHSGGILPSCGNQKGQWDTYLIRSAIPGQSISFVSARWAELGLTGTNGWFVTDFNVRLRTVDQTVAATGSSQIYSNPNVWLDNQLLGLWDYYRRIPLPGTTGTLYF